MDLWLPVFLVGRSICQFVVVSLTLLSFRFSRSSHMALNINERQGYHKLQKIQWIFHFQLLYVAYLHASVSCLGSKIISKLDIISQSLLVTKHFWSNREICLCWNKQCSDDAKISNCWISIQSLKFTQFVLVSHS